MAVAGLANRQGGVVALDQLRPLGFSGRGVAHRVAAGRLHPVFRGVYAIGHPVISRQTRMLAATLSVGKDAVVSYDSAGWLWGIVSPSDSPVHLTAPRRLRRRRGLQIHFSRRLDPGDVTVRHGIPVTSVARTLLDLTERLNDRDLRRAVREAQVQRLVTEGDLGRQLARANGRHRARRLRALVASGWLPTRSDLEDLTLALLEDHGLPRPATNARLPGFGRPMEVDFFYPEVGLVIEADGARFHDNRIARRDDAAKQAMLEAAGYRVVRLRWEEVVNAPQQTAARVRAAYDAQRDARKADADAPG